MTALPNDLAETIWKLYFRTYLGFLAIGAAFLGLLSWVPLPAGFQRSPALIAGILVLVALQVGILLLFPKIARQRWLSLVAGNLAAMLGILGETTMFGTQISVMMLLWPMTLAAGFYGRSCFQLQSGITALSALLISYVKARYHPDPLWWLDGLALSVPIVAMGSMMAFFRETALNKAALLAHQSGTDYLTGLPNRRSLFENLLDWQPPSAVNAVVMFDLDHFKAVNDKLGHQVGDDVLRALARLLQKHLRGGELGVRTGGEEFLWLISAQSRDEILRRAEGFREGVAVELRHYGVTVSLGIRFFGEQSLNAEHFGHLMSEADKALYRAKAEGRNCLRIA